MERLKGKTAIITNVASIAGQTIISDFGSTL